MKHQKDKKIVKPIKSAEKPINFLKPKDDFKTLSTCQLSKHEKSVFVSHKKNRPISRKAKLPEAWNEHDAQEAIKLEQTFVERMRKSQILVIHFPDEPISINKVRSYSINIDSVRFIQSGAPRYCFVMLKPEADVKEEISKISKIPFQNGFLKAKLRSPEAYEPPPLAAEVDPTTLYIGNLPSDVNIAEIRAHFENAVRIELGHSLKKKWRRYALVDFGSSSVARQAFIQSFDSQIRLNSLVVRFHRVKHWKILEQIQLKNQESNVKIKNEKEDSGYDEVLRRATEGFDSAQQKLPTVTQIIPASFPIARPMIELSVIKQERITPPLEVEENEALSEDVDPNALPTLTQYQNYALPSQSQQQNHQRQSMKTLNPFDPEQLALMCQQSDGSPPLPDMSLQQQPLIQSSIFSPIQQEITTACALNITKDLSKKPLTSVTILNDKTDLTLTATDEDRDFKTTKKRALQAEIVSSATSNEANSEAKPSQQTTIEIQDNGNEEALPVKRVRSRWEPLNTTAKLNNNLSAQSATTFPSRKLH